jgi:tripartite ATP-independent transporter DctM subunit
VVLAAAILLAVLALLGMPLFGVIGGGALLGFHSADIDTAAVMVEFYRMASAPTLLAIPLFTFAGYLLAESKAPDRLLAVSRALFGWMPGGVAFITLITCAGFTAFTGASGATLVALGGLLFPMLQQEGFREKFSLGLLTTSGSLGLLFAPSLPLILYGLVAQARVDHLFLAGFFPGLLIIAILATYSVFTGAGLGRGRARHSFSWREIGRALQSAGWELPLIPIVLVGIYGGFFTATEAAAVTAFYLLVVEVFVYKDLGLRRDLPRIMRESMILVGGILIILGTALGFTSFLIDEQVPMRLLETVRETIDSRITFLIVLNIFLLVVGMMMDIFSAIIVVVPLITPIAMEFGINPVHLGIIFLTNLEIGYATPPVGLNLFIASYRFERPVTELYRASLPFLGLLLIALIIITYWPDLSLFLVRWVAGP